jgi:hypothetical protein
MFLNNTPRRKSSFKIRRMKDERQINFNSGSSFAVQRKRL